MFGFLMESSLKLILTTVARASQNSTVRMIVIHLSCVRQRTHEHTNILYMMVTNSELHNLCHTLSSLRQQLGTAMALFYKCKSKAWNAQNLNRNTNSLSSEQDLRPNHNASLGKQKTVKFHPCSMTVKRFLVCLIASLWV